MLVFAAIGLVVLALFTNSGTATFQLVSGDLQNNCSDYRHKAAALILADLCGAWSRRRHTCCAGSRGYSGCRRSARHLLHRRVPVLGGAARQDFPAGQPVPGTLNFATPLILGALAGVLCERAGVINIAIEGQFLVGAFTAAVVASTTVSADGGTDRGSLDGRPDRRAAGGVLDPVPGQPGGLGVVLVVFASGITGYPVRPVPAGGRGST